MRDYIRFILKILILFSFFTGNAQLENGKSFKYRNREIVVFDYYDGKVSLDYLSPNTKPFRPKLYEVFGLLDTILNSIELQKGDVMQLYFYKDATDLSHIYINLLQRKILKHYKTYKQDFIPLCLDDCGSINDFHKIYILDISTKKVINY